MRALTVSLFATLGLTGCVVAQIRPAPAGQQVAPVGNVASATASGVRVSVDGTAWNGYPSDLGQYVSPIYVSIENHSGHPIRVQYSDFQIVGGSGFRYIPLAFLNQKNQPNSPNPTGPKSPSPPPDRNLNPPPSDPPPTLHQAPDGTDRAPGISDLNDGMTAPDSVETNWLTEADPLSGRVQLAVARGPLLARYHGHRGYYWVRPYWGPRFWYPYGGWYPYAYWYGDPYYRWQVQLPTQDMVNAGLPEGTIDDGGHVAGFLYFQRLTHRESQLQFEARLPDAKEGETVATISIPLIVAR